ncbi:arf GTPase activating protein [Artemisia annua]|uniref:Arf GTPase activating protein n=1 Tax=Artemisia annua TaxID=35608 RepID=A0A2U1LNA0_ARTAN|nr:arf GTPase activating protein [Artemisia annua]
MGSFGREFELPKGNFEYGSSSRVVPLEDLHLPYMGGKDVNMAEADHGNHFGQDMGKGFGNPPDQQGYQPNLAQELALARALNMGMEQNLGNLQAENEDIKVKYESMLTSYNNTVSDLTKSQQLGVDLSNTLARVYKEKSDLAEDLGWVSKKGPLGPSPRAPSGMVNGVSSVIGRWFSMGCSFKSSRKTFVRHVIKLGIVASVFISVSLGFVELIKMRYACLVAIFSKCFADFCSQVNVVRCYGMGQIYGVIGSAAISSADLFGHDDSNLDLSASDLINRLSFQAQQDMSSLKNIAGETGKKLSSIASTLMNDFQDRILSISGESPQSTAIFSGYLVASSIPLCYS